MQRTLEEVRRLAEEDPAQPGAIPQERRPLRQKLSAASRGRSSSPSIRDLALERMLEEKEPLPLLVEEKAPRPMFAEEKAIRPFLAEQKAQGQCMAEEQAPWSGGGEVWRSLSEDKAARSASEDEKSSGPMAPQPFSLDGVERSHVLFGGLDKDSSSQTSSIASGMSQRQRGTEKRLDSATANGGVHLVETQSSTSKSGDSVMMQSERMLCPPQNSDHEGEVPGEGDWLPDGAPYNPDDSDEADAEPSPDEIPSVGSVWYLHTQDPVRCSPCRFLADPRGCSYGYSCTFCHFSHDHLTRDKRKPRPRPCKGQRLRHRKQVDELMAQVNAAPEEWDPANAELPPQIASNERVAAKVVEKLVNRKTELLRKVHGDRMGTHEQEFLHAAQPKLNAQRRRDLRRLAERDARRAAQAEEAAAEAAAAEAEAPADQAEAAASIAASSKLSL